MSTPTIEVVNVKLKKSQQKAMRMLALGNSKMSASEMADNLLAIAIRGRFKAVTETVGKDAAKMYDNAVSRRMTPTMSDEFLAEHKSKTAEEKVALWRPIYIANTVKEYTDVMNDLNNKFAE